MKPAAAEKPATKSAPKYFDVARPNKTAASATAKPVIVSNRPMLDDPMVSKTEGQSEVKSAAPKVVIKPLSEDETQDDNKETTETTEAAPKDEEVKVDETAETEKTTEAPAPAENEESDTNETTDSDVSELDQTKDEKEAAALEALAKHEEEINQIVESHEYFLPIETAEEHRSRVVTLAGLCVIILLGLMLADLLLDVGILHVNGVQPLTHFFSS